jgi:ABC-type transporter Mla subunit MlaD
MMTRKELDLWVGIFAMIGFAAMLFLSLKVANLASSDHGKVRQYRRAEGSRAGQEFGCRRRSRR